MKWLPDTALGRTALLIVGVLLFSQVANILLLRHVVVHPAAEQAAALLTLQIRLAAQGDEEALQSVRWAREPPGQPLGYMRYFSVVESTVRTRLPESEVRLLGDDQPRLWVRPAHARQWMGLALTNYDQRAVWLLLGWLAVSGLVAVVAALFFARHLNRPLVELAAAARDVGHGRLPQVRPSGPRELRQLGVALAASAQAVREATAEREFMLAGVSHDLRTPLARMRFALEMLNGGDAALRQGLADDVDELEHITDQFIGYVRAGYDEIPCPSDLNALVTAAAEACHQPIELHLQPLPLLSLRPVAIRRLLDNLLFNALRHGALPLTVETREGPDSVDLVVRDTGPGIPLDEVPRLLKPFTARHPAQGRTGHGLGLAVVSRIIEQHEGRLAFHNDDGLVVTVRLPVRKRGECA